MIFQCQKCHEVFESQGIQIIVNGESAGYVCPSCIAGAETIHLVLERVALSPKPLYELKAIDIQPASPVKN